jgi:hypothetical protein
MLSARPLISTIGIALACTACASGGGPANNTPPQPPGATPAGMQFGGLGQVGDTIYFIDMHVKANAREGFESFVRDMLWPSFQRANAPGMPGDDLLRRIRLMQPQAANVEDGTFTYTFILDPVVPGFTYNVLEVLRATHGEAGALEQYNNWTATWARDFTVRRYVQSK